MRVVQLRSYLSYGDGIGNTIIKMDEVLSERYLTMIAVMNYSKEYDNHPRLIQFNDIDKLDLREDDIVIYHFGGYDILGRDIRKIKCKRIIMYQNVTYPFFYNGIDNITMSNCAEGQRYIRNVQGVFLKAIAPSQFSCDELVEMGWDIENVYNIPIPVFIDNKKRIKRKEKKKNILFVGRIVPNKKIEDVIRIYDYFKNNYDVDCCLKLVGTVYNDVYFETLQKYVIENDIKGIDFLEHISDEELEKIYASSDIFVCMSEHEGFCMPLIEAMSYEIPVIAYNSTAVPDTMGDAGILMNSKDLKKVCDNIYKIFIDDDFKNKLVKKQKRHIDNYIKKDYKEKIFEVIESVNEITEYAYDELGFEFYEMLLRGIEQHSFDDLIEQFHRLQNMECSIVVYGVGKVGRFLLELLEDEKVVVDALCDIKEYNKIIYDKRILAPEECVERFKDAIYIITIQNKEIAQDVSTKLSEMDVSLRNIYYYSNEDKRIYI